MEKKFLQYLLYVTLVEIRELAYEENNHRMFHLADILHNIPLALDSDESVEGVYNDLLINVADLKVEAWLMQRKNEFFLRYPEYEV